MVVDKLWEVDGGGGGLLGVRVESVVEDDKDTTGVRG